MKTENFEERIAIPEHITIKLENGILTAIGPKGETKRNIYLPGISTMIESREVVIRVGKYTKKEKKLIGSLIAHIKNLLRGVTEGFAYKLKICSGHFPMNVSVKGNEMIIKNYIGEKVPRILKFNPAVKVTIEGENVIVESNDIEIAGQTAGLIEKISARTGFDRRVFQQGIFICQKPK